ncbi:threonine aldolase family protein [Desulfohalovibrio reitneri]|uniref:threonine aldolase family protein n=1 Tax=Desulfohalovibrio reitneri TaxID=1307759 RepID=UPI0004A73A85|nr:low specificity L-threonine aldolase [Desulfohalovibrio reitneri]
MQRSFASDNTAPVHPRVMRALEEANQGRAAPYGNDSLSQRAAEAMQEAFGPDAHPFLVFLGTGANVLCLESLIRPHQSVLCATTAHINRDECGAPQRYTGSKLVTVEGSDGKITPDELAPHLHSLGFEHHAQPGAVSITQCTELGTLYSPKEIRVLADFAHQHGMKLHMDGARLANACAALGCSLKELTADCGVDALSFGGTKNGLMFGEAVVLFGDEAARDFVYRRKQAMQLYSKMRYTAAQFLALLEDDLWLENAVHANAMAVRLAEAVRDAPGVEITRPVETNHVFARLPLEATRKLQEDWTFYLWDPEDGIVRWMTSFDTTEEEVDNFAEAIRQAVAAA